MTPYTSYYQILKVPPTADKEQIKTAFRKLALQQHPDTSQSSPESGTAFLLVLNAYTILSDPISRREYDIYLRGSSVLSGYRQPAAATLKKLPGRPGDTYKSNEQLLEYFNFLLWEIEDLLGSGQTAVHEPLLQILSFIDKWVLHPAGYPDYFSQARGREQSDPMEYTRDLTSRLPRHGHRAFVSVQDYFYDIRKRMDRFMTKTRPGDLFLPLPGLEIRLIDSILKSQNFAVHSLSYLVGEPQKSIAAIPPYNHTHTCFQP